MFSHVLKRGWYPAVITIVAILSLIFYDVIPYAVSIPVLVVMLSIGGIIVYINGRKNQLEMQSMRLSQLATHFNRRFMGNSQLSIFEVINGLFGLENEQVWEWARGCEMTRRVFDSWAENFAARVENDLRSRRHIVFLQTHINELWALNNHYHEFTEQFVEIVNRFDVPKDVLEQFNKFTEEYNVFVQNFREAINELKTIAHTQLEAPSVKTVKELKR